MDEPGYCWQIFIDPYPQPWVPFAFVSTFTVIRSGRKDAAAVGTETATAVTGTVTEIVTVIGTVIATGTVDVEDGAGVTMMITLTM